MYYASHKGLVLRELNLEDSLPQAHNTVESPQVV